MDVIAKFEGVIKDLESSIVQARTLNATLQTLMKCVELPESRLSNIIILSALEPFVLNDTQML